MALISKLEAVNSVLRALGQKPVNSILNPASKNTQMVVQALDLEISRLQSEEWDFNVDEDLILPVDMSSGEIPIPASVTRFDVGEEPWIVVRGSRLFNRRDQTFVFEEAKRGRATYALDWDELPEPAKLYVIARTSRKTYDTLVGANSATRQSLAVDEADARRSLLEFDSEMGSYSMLDTGVFTVDPNFYSPFSPRRGQRLNTRTQE